MAKEILINQLFAGNYLNEGKNIGHEVINLFKDDDGNHNLFITPSGYVKGHDLEFILFVRHVSDRRTVEVVGVAKEITSVTDEDVKKVRYAGVSLYQIFKSNTYHGGDDSPINQITFRARKFMLPSCRIFISLDKNKNVGECMIHIDSKKKVITPQSLRTYYSKEKDPKAYVQLRELIENQELWDDTQTLEKLYLDGSVHNQQPSFLEVIGKENDEIVFSNLLGYFFEYSHRSFHKFAAKLLGIPDMSTNFVLIREDMEHVDLWIESEKDIIVIENKIKSGINGIISDDYSQLNKYYEFAEKEKDKSKKRTHYYIFAPGYARFDLSQFGLEDKYKIIKYSDLYKFFIEETETYIADRSFPDFVRGLKRHTLTYPELQFETMRSRLLRKIDLLQ